MSDEMTQVYSDTRTVHTCRTRAAVWLARTPPDPGTIATAQVWATLTVAAALREIVDEIKGLRRDLEE